MLSALFHVDKSFCAVTSALEHAVTVSKRDHTKCAKTHVTVFWFVHIAVEHCAVSLAHRVPEIAVDVALTKNAASNAWSHAIHVGKHAPGFVLITNAKIRVMKSATVLDVTHPAPRSSLVATLVLVCVEKTVPLCVLLARPKISLR